MEFGIGLEPLFRGTILMLLKVRDEIIENVGEVVFKTVVADESFGPYKEAGASLRDKGDTDRGVDEPRGKEGVQFIESVLEFRSSVEELRLTAIERLDDALDVLLDIPIPQGLIPMQFRKFVDIKRTVCNSFHSGLGHPVPTRENVMRELQGLHKGVLGHTWLVGTRPKTLAPQRAPLRQSLLNLLEHNHEVIETTGVGLKILVEICEFGGGIGVHLIHSGGETVEHCSQSGGIRRIWCKGLRA